ncbi:hypothetical protein MKX08_005737 [Trichoderma sp. CBMAI-0020]|nr:hypothetical protein MKX08_005737 [Trichoderma sp. CBMAI-0020]
MQPGTAAQIQHLEDAPPNLLTGTAWPQATMAFFKLVVACQWMADTKRSSTRITSLSRVADEMSVVLREEVGYKIHNDHKFSKHKTRFTYMTQGVLLRH